jgi:NAD+ diphosphatase
VSDLVRARPGALQDVMPPALSGYAFASAPLDRADALRDDAQALARLWPDAHLLVLDTEGMALADPNGQRSGFTGRDAGPSALANALLLGVRDGQAWFSIDAEAVDVSAPQRVDLRQAAATWHEDESSAFAHARAMQHWRTRTQHCGRCGGRVAFRRAGYVASCSQCGTEHYPRVDPAIIVAVTDGERLLLGRQASWPEGRYSVIAGFVEPGESLEQTVVREVHEETQVRVRSCRYLGGQPWPFPGALMLGFEAEAEPDTPKVDGELEDARWFTVDEIAAARSPQREHGGGLRLSPSISIARALIEHWYQRMTA